MLQPYLAEAARLALTGGTLSGAGRLRFGDAQGPKLAYTGTASLDKVSIEETAPRRHFMSWDAVAASDMRLTLSPNRLDELFAMTCSARLRASVDRTSSERPLEK